jgi:hypothetical protein
MIDHVHRWELGIERSILNILSDARYYIPTLQGINSSCFSQTHVDLTCNLHVLHSLRPIVYNH